MALSIAEAEEDWYVLYQLHDAYDDSRSIGVGTMPPWGDLNAGFGAYTTPGDETMFGELRSVDEAHARVSCVSRLRRVH